MGTILRLFTDKSLWKSIGVFAYFLGIIGATIFVIGVVLFVILTVLVGLRKIIRKVFYG